MNIDGRMNQKIRQEIYFNQNVAFAMEDLAHYGSLIRARKDDFSSAIGKVKDYLQNIQGFANVQIEAI